MIAILSISHFMVDLTCSLLVASLAKTNLVTALLLYNFCAFALQMPLGIVVENRFPPLKIASVGVGMVLVSWLFLNQPIIALIVAGVGNALFHLGGGLSVMGASPKAAPLGVFIAPGALGIYLGANLQTTWQLPILMIMGLLVLMLWKKQEENTIFLYKQEEIKRKELAVTALFLVVVIRGFLGMSPVFPWKSQWSVAFVIAVVLGKIVGGYLADHFGAKKVGIVSLAVSAICFLFVYHPVFGLIGVFAFQITMPITLWEVSKITFKGFGFGLLTFGLFIGSLPTFLGLNFAVPLIILVIISLILFIFGLKKEVLS